MTLPAQMNIPGVIFAFVGTGVILLSPFLFKLGQKLMALDFTKLQAAAATLSTQATDLQTQAAASTDVANQAVIDGVTSSLQTASSTLATLLPTPAPAADETVS